MPKLLSIVGARPQFIKLASFLPALEDYNKGTKRFIEHTLLHTGQHYDTDMSDIFFEELAIPPADINLGVGSGTHGQQTGKMLEGVEAILKEKKPDMLLIFGDTNSTLAGALAAAKMQIPIAHVEAGLRSFNRSMPEEINRITADHLSDILLAPTPIAVDNLRREGLAEKTLLTGDIMLDTVLRNIPLAVKKANFPLPAKAYYLATLHRPENTDNPQRLQAILDQLNEIAANSFPVVFPIHPRTAKRLGESLPDWRPNHQLKIIPPVGYLDMLRLMNDARLIFTDSGGLQKEAFFLNCPCITLREETEWVETVTSGGNVLTGADPKKINRAVRDWERQMNEQRIDFSVHVRQYFGTGNAAEKILCAIVKYLA